MATNDRDDLMPRPLPKPSQLEEVCTKPEVPEVSLVFDSLSANSTKFNTSPINQNTTIQQMNALSLNKPHFFPNHYEHHYSSPLSSKPPLNQSPLINSYLKTTNKLEDHGFPGTKKVSFSPHMTQNGNNFEHDIEAHGENENSNCHCNQDTGATPKLNQTARSTPDNKKSTCSCATCALDSCDYPSDHTSGNFIRLLKNVERKINTKVSFDDLQKTELKIENILLKHKCKYDKLGENCVTREEFNRVIQKYENQINLLQLRVEELTQKLSYPPLRNTSCGREVAKCNCSNSLNICPRSPPAPPVINGAVKCSNHNYCSSHVVPSSNGKYYQEMCRKFETEEASIPYNDHVIHKQTQVNMQVANADKQEIEKQKIFYENCCRNRENVKSPDRREVQHNGNAVVPENLGQYPMHNFHHSPIQCGSEPRQMPKSNSSNEQHKEQRVQSQNFPYEPLPQEIRKDHQVVKAAEKNIRLDWTFYSNIVEDVKNLMQQNPNTIDRNGDTVDLIKKATMEQLQKMGINIDTNISNEKPREDQCQKKFIPGSSAPSPDLSFHVNSLAMKYVSDVPPNGDYYNKKSTVNDISFRSNCNNVSIATLQYMERYQLLPNTDQRYGGNHGDFNKYEQNISQEHRHKLYKQTENNDRSFIR